MYGDQIGEFVCGYWGLKGYSKFKRNLTFLTCQWEGAKLLSWIWEWYFFGMAQMLTVFPASLVLVTVKKAGILLNY